MKFILPTLLVTFLTFCSCRNHTPTTPPFLRSVDSIVLSCNRTDSNKTIKITDAYSVEIFTEIVSLTKEPLQGDTCMGKIKYYEGGKMIFLVTYCEGIRYNWNGETYSERITYRAGRYFEEACYRISQEKTN